MNLSLRQELKELLNRHSAENKSNTPDWILAEYIESCLNAFDLAVNQRDLWYDISPEPGWEPRHDSEQPEKK